jgi:hypothetical protein
MRQTNPETGIGFPEPVGSEFRKILLACVFELPGGCQCVAASAMWRAASAPMQAAITNTAAPAGSDTAAATAAGEEGEWQRAPQEKSRRRPSGPPLNPANGALSSLMCQG